MAPVIGGPLLVALGALTRIRALTRLGTVLAIGSTAAMAEIGSRKVVPGANDNGTAVVSLLALARRLAESPAPGVRVILLSAGAEESFSEGIKAFGERHFADLPTREHLLPLLESTGSPHLLVLRGEGFLKMYDYPAQTLELLDTAAAELGIWLYPEPAPAQRHRRHRGARRGLRIGGDRRLRRPQAALQLSLADDLAENVDFGTVADGIRLGEAAIRASRAHR